MENKILIVDMTHGGYKLALEFSKREYEVYAWDIYYTLKKEQKKELKARNIPLVDGNFLKDNKVIIVAPVHCNIDFHVDMTHHQAVAFLLKNEIKIPVIEVTGVKGKTSASYMLAEILKSFKPLILSSLGVEVYDEGHWKQLQRDISITPASILTAWELGKNYCPGIFIAETSLGGTGLGRIGVLTNIAEDYPIASGSKTASIAKEQIFHSDMVACEYQAFFKFYSKYKQKTNTFSLTEGNLKAKKVSYGLTETVIDLRADGLKTVNGRELTDNFQIKTFAPAPHHVENVLSAVCTSLTCGISINRIKSGLKNFNGLKGRTSLKYRGNTVIIEEINPGINSIAVKRAVDMLKGMPESLIIFGGQYGVTCEEIDEKTVSLILNEIPERIDLLLADELGAALTKLVKRPFKYVKKLQDAVNFEIIHNYRTVLLIYRSNYPDIEHR